MCPLSFTIRGLALTNLKYEKLLIKYMKTNIVSKKVVISAIAGLVVAVVVIYLAYVSINHYENAVVLKSQQQMLMSARSIAVGIEGLIAEHSNDLKTISENPRIQEKIFNGFILKETSTDHCICLDLYKTHKDHIDALTILDDKGIVLRRLPYSEETIGKDQSDKPGVAHVLKYHERHVSEVFYNNMGKLAIFIFEPVFYMKKFAGIVRWMIQIDRISKRFVEKVPLSEKSFVWIFDNREVILSHSRKEHIGMSVLDVIRKKHNERGEVFDESRLKEHINEEHDYLNRVKVEEEGYGLCVNCVTDENELVAYKKLAIGDRNWNLIITVPYSEITGPIFIHARNTLGLAAVVILLFGFGSMVLYRTQKGKAELETKAKYLKEIAVGAEVLRESEEKLSGIIESIIDRMSMIDEQYNIVWANDVAKELFGPDLVGKKCYSTYHGQDKPCDPCVVMKCFKDGKAHEHETEVIGSDENRMIYSCTANVAARYKDGQPRTVVEISRNITEDKRTQEALKESEQRFRRLADLLPQPVFELDLEGNFTYSNLCGLEAFGYSNEDLENGVNVLELFIEEERQRVRQNIHKRLAGEEFEDHEYTGLRKDGSTFPILVYSAPIVVHNEPVGLRGIVIDITDRKQAVEEQGQRERLQGVIEMAGAVCHELSQPMQIISIYSQLLMADKREDNSLHGNIKKIKTQIDRMEKIKNNLMRITRYERKDYIFDGEKIIDIEKASAND